MTSKEALEEIEYDLKILELLRKYVFFDNTDNHIKMVDIKECVNNFHFEILKEWLELENDNERENSID